MGGDRQAPGGVTSRDVARAAGVSQSAVSRAFARAAGVSAATRERILKIADELGYQPNALASGLITRKSGIVGIVLSQLGNPFLSEAAERLLIQLRKRGFQVLVVSAETDKEMGEAAAGFGRYRVDGCFVISPHLPRSVAKMYDGLGPTVVLFNRQVPGLRASAVTVDNIAAGGKAADHLMELGHRHLGYIHGTIGATADRDRYKGFSRRISETGLPPPVEGHGGFTYDDAAAASVTMLGATDRPSAVFCADDIMAMATLDVARHRLGIKVPEDLSVVGFDDAASAAWPSYDLTTFRQPIDEMVKAAIDMFMGTDTHADAPNKTLVFDAELILRGSIAPPTR